MPIPDQACSVPTSYIILKVSQPTPVYLPQGLPLVTDTRHPNQSVPLPLHLMLAEYVRLGSRLRAHYLSPAVFLCLITGRFVPPIHRKNLYSLQYSMLPARRAGVGELWVRLTEQGRRRKREKMGAQANGHARKVSANGGVRRGYHY